MLSVVGHDLSDLQDNDDGREESVDDSDSEKGASSFAGWVRAQGPKEPSLHAKPLKSALKKSGGNGSSNNNSPSSSTPVPTPTQDHMEHSRGGAVSWQEPPPPPPPASTRPLRFGITLGGGNSSSNGPVAHAGSAHDHNHNMQQKTDNNHKEVGGSSQRPTYLPVHPVANNSVDYDSDSSDGPILYRDDDDENSSDEARLASKIARKDSLALKLAMRPDRQELIDRGILHAQTERERHLQREAVHARLSRRLSLRPTQEELEERNILKRTSPAEEKKEREEKKMTLFRKLSFRPTVDELKARKIIRFNDYVEVADAQDYDRRADRPWTRLTPQEKAAIRKELNEFKSTEMMVHVDSLYMIRFHKWVASDGPLW